MSDVNSPSTGASGDDATENTVNTPAADVSLNDAPGVSGDVTPVDRVVQPSRHADGSLAHDNVEFIGDKATSEALNSEQLKQVNVSNLDQARLAAAGADAAASANDGEYVDPATRQRIEENGQAEDEAESQAKSEVDEHFKG